MSDVYVKIKMGQKLKKDVKLKSLTLNNGTLAMVFRLILNQEVSVRSFKEGEKILPFWLLAF